MLKLLGSIHNRHLPLTRLNLNHASMASDIHSVFAQHFCWNISLGD